MPGKGHAYQITPEWQRVVRQRLVEMGITQNELARRAGITISSMSAALAPTAIQSTKIPQINRVIGLPPPLDKPSTAALEAARYLDLLDDLEKGRWVERLKQEAEKRRKR